MHLQRCAKTLNKLWGILKNFAKRHGTEQTAAEMALSMHGNMSYDGGIIGKMANLATGLKGEIGARGMLRRKRTQNQETFEAMRNSDEGRRLSEGIGDSSNMLNNRPQTLMIKARDAAQSFQGAYATMTQASEQFQKCICLVW